MFKKVLIGAGIPLLLGITYTANNLKYLRQDLVQATIPSNQRINTQKQKYQILLIKSPQRADYVLKQLIKFGLLKNNPKEKQSLPRALADGFDIEGELMEGLFELGYDMLLVGPINYDATDSVQENTSDDKQYFPSHMGILYLKSNLASYKPKNKRIGVTIIPSQQILIYTPYLLKQEYLRSVKEIKSSVDVIVLDLRERYINYIPDGFQNTKLIQELIKQCSEEAKKQNTRQVQLFIKVDLKNLSETFLKSESIDGFVLTEQLQEQLKTTKTVISPGVLHNNIKLQFQVL